MDVRRVFVALASAAVLAGCSRTDPAAAASAQMPAGSPVVSQKFTQPLRYDDVYRQVDCQTGSVIYRLGDRADIAAIDASVAAGPAAALKKICGGQYKTLYGADDAANHIANQRFEQPSHFGHIYRQIDCELGNVIHSIDKYGVRGNLTVTSASKSSEVQSVMRQICQAAGKTPGF